MMELSHNMILDEGALAQVPAEKKPLFVYEWLRFLDKVLMAAQQHEVIQKQPQLIEQITNHIEDSPGPPTRKLLAKCLATLFSVGDICLLGATVNKCNDILKNKDDSPSFLNTKLAAICCLGSMYEKLGRMMGRNQDETVQILIRCLKNGESQTRTKIMLTLRKICTGMGSVISNLHKDIYKAARTCLIDRSPAVRCAAANCLLEMLNSAPFIYTTELESLASLCFRAFDGSNCEVRYTVAKLLGNLIAANQQNQNEKVQPGVKSVSLDEALGILMSGFLRGGNSFLKGTGEIIKGSSSVNREVRIGVTQAYVIFIQIMGGPWVEKNMKVLLNHILRLVANPKAASSHVDAVYSRNCVNFILRSVFGRMLGEKAQVSACKEIITIIKEEMASIDFTPENSKDLNQETVFSQHLLVCALLELGNLFSSLGTIAHDLTTDTTLNTMESICSVLYHPCQAARLAASWCLRCICIAVPSQTTPLINRCIMALEHVKISDCISGFSCTLAATLGVVRMSPYGIPHSLAKSVFNTAEHLLRSATTNSRFSLTRAQSSWLIFGAVMTLGTPVVQPLLPRLILLWKNSFPRSAAELESEKDRGDAFTWQLSLENRAGALAVMHSFFQNCPELVEENTKRLLPLIESAMSLLGSISNILTKYGQQLKAPAAMVRLRIYEALLQLPPESFENMYTHLLRRLVAEFTLADNPANTTTSQLRAVCHADDSVILGTWLQETDHRIIEDQIEPYRRTDGQNLQPNSAAGSGALEHDLCCIYRPLNTGETIPGPLPLGVSVIDVSIALFGQIFPKVTNKHRLQMLNHFSECIKHAKSARQEAIQINIFTALLSGLKGLNDVKKSLVQEEVKQAARNLIIGTLTSPNHILRCAAGEAVGRMAQVVREPVYTASLAQTSFDKLTSARDLASRTGHSLALGCLHRYVGGINTNQHLNTSVSILLALAQDAASPVVQAWALHALALIADSGGPMFRTYVEPTLGVILKLLFTVPQSHTEIHQCIGKVLSGMITTVGPELQGTTNTMSLTRWSFLCACNIMQDHHDPVVQAEATGCLQQLHLFAPRHVNLSSLVPTLCRTLSSNHLLLRKAAVSCLRQLAQREAKEICEHALTLANESRESNTVEGLLITESGLPGALFRMLDTETDSGLIKNIHDTITSMLQMLAVENLSQWLGLCKDVLTIAAESANMDERTNGVVKHDESEDVEADDDEMKFHAEEDNDGHSAVPPRWPTRVFAAECVRKIISACKVHPNKAHFDLILAKEANFNGNSSDFLVLHLSDLIRISFIAATSDSDPLRLEGLKTLKEIIENFAHVAEPEFPGHLLLEQCQAQVGAALHPAFSSGTSPYVTSAACEVCSTWIGSNVARDFNGLRRVHQLLVSSLDKPMTLTSSNPLYNESLVTLEILSVLKAWAEVYIIAMDRNDGTYNNEELDNAKPSLLKLIQPQLDRLSKHWLCVVRDYQLLCLPTTQIPHDGGTFFTFSSIETTRSHYSNAWPQVLLAATLLLKTGGYDSNNNDANVNNIFTLSTKEGKFNLLYGSCTQALCCTKTSETNRIICLKSMCTLLDSSWSRKLLYADATSPFDGERNLGLELCNILYRIVLTSDSQEPQFLSMEIIKRLLLATQECFDDLKNEKLEDYKQRGIQDELDYLGDGGQAGQIDSKTSIVFAMCQVCICLLFKHIPAINPSCPNHSMQIVKACPQLVASAFANLEYFPMLCSPEGSTAILTTILHMVTSVLQEIATKKDNDSTVLANNIAVQAILHCLKVLVTSPYATDERCQENWQKLLQSALAKILHLAKSGSGENKLDEVTTLLIMGVFILHAPPDVVLISSLKFPSINYFRQCIASDNSAVRLTCIQTLKSIFAHSSQQVSKPYVHSLIRRLIEFLQSDSAKNVLTDSDLSVTMEALLTLQYTVDLAEPDSRNDMLEIVVPLLVSYLLAENAINAANKNSIKLHDTCLQWLMNMGNNQDYQKGFVNIIGKSQYLRRRLHSAAKIYKEMQQTKTETVNTKPTTSQKPSIKLRQDFSNFA